MKFGKRLQQQIQESLPDWRDKFLSYKNLKKVVKLITSTPPSLNGSLEYLKAEEEFVYWLNNEIEKLNAFFMEQEEDFIIKQKQITAGKLDEAEDPYMSVPPPREKLSCDFGGQKISHELQQRIQSVIDIWGPNGTHPSDTIYKEEMDKIRKRIVNFHGEMVLLLNYSTINYTGLAKILKKYDKRTGGLLRLPFIQKVLKQPFFTTDLVSKLIKECENTIEAVFPVEEEGKKVKREAIRVTREGIFRNTVAALVTMQEIRSGSSTYSHYSLPPLSLPDSDLIHSFRLTSPIPIV